MPKNTSGRKIDPVTGGEISRRQYDKLYGRFAGSSLTPELLARINDEVERTSKNGFTTIDIDVGLPNDLLSVLNEVKSRQDAKNHRYSMSVVVNAKQKGKRNWYATKAVAPSDTQALIDFINQILAKYKIRASGFTVQIHPAK